MPDPEGTTNARVLPESPDKSQNKNLYCPGDKVKRGDTIAQIYISTKNWIFFRNAFGNLCWECSGVPDHTRIAQTNFQRLLARAETQLSKSRLATAHLLLATGLAGAFTSDPSEDMESYLAPARDFIEKYEEEVAQTIATGHTFAVYRMRSGGLSWYHSKVPDYLAPAVEEYEGLNSLIHTVLPEAHKGAASQMLGAAISTAFRKGQDEDVRSPFNGARDFIVSQTIAAIKVRMFIVGVSATVGLVALLLATSAIASLDPMYLVAIGFGAIGAMVSALQRNNDATVNPYGSRLAMYSESLSRLLIGSVFGLVILLVIYADLAFAPFKTNQFALALLAFVGGFTERFVPDLISSVSKQSQ